MLSSPSIPARERLLIVDDDSSTRALILAMLEDSDWNLDAASDANAALTKIAAEAYDVVLTDINMPGMDGLSLLRRIRELRPDTRVIVMTAENVPENVARSLREQAFSYIVKPFTSDALSDLLTRAVQDRPDGDDIELISVLPNWISLDLRCKISTANRLLPFFREMASTLTLEDREMIGTAFRELLLNAIEHGGKFDAHKKVQLMYVRTAREIIYYLKDPGEGFSFDGLTHAAVSNPPGDPFAHLEPRAKRGLRAGGFGILLARKFADVLLYSEKGNEVILVKHLDK